LNTRECCPGAAKRADATTPATPAMNFRRFILSTLGVDVPPELLAIADEVGVRFRQHGHAVAFGRRTMCQEATHMHCTNRR
jgi:hypothetical protein